MATNLPYWKPLHKEGLSSLPNQVLEDQLNMIDVPSAAGDPFLAISPAIGGHSWKAEVLGIVFGNGSGWAEEEGAAAHGLPQEPSVWR